MVRVVDGLVNPVVNAQCDLVFAGAQSAFKQQPVLAFGRQSAVEAARPSVTTRNSDRWPVQLCADPFAFCGEAGGIVVAPTVARERNQFGAVEGLGRW